MPPDLISAEIIDCRCGGPGGARTPGEDTLRMKAGLGTNHILGSKRERWMESRNTLEEKTKPAGLSNGLNWRQRERL